MTAVDWSNFCCEVVYDAMVERSEPIGGYDENGQSIIVEIDESKFGKRNYHRGHHVDAQWVRAMNFLPLHTYLSKP